jgi:hypothetical protein
VENRLDKKYLARLGSFEKLHPPAYRFLTRLQSEGSADGLWLSTATNAHLYKGNAFLAYFKLNNPELKPSSLLLSPRYNVLIADDSTDRSELLFPRLVTNLLMAAGGFSARWALPRTGGAIELTPKASDAFFDKFYAELQKLEIAA